MLLDTDAVNGAMRVFLGSHRDGEFADADYLLCGPTTLMAALQGDLRKRRVDPDRIHSETFGPRS